MTVTDGRRRGFVAGVSDVVGLTRTAASVERLRFVTQWLGLEAA
jgi:hypothetical protein